MDVALLVAVLVIGFFWGSYVWGSKPEKPTIAPCVCHCDCLANPSSGVGGRELFAWFTLGLSWLVFCGHSLYCWKVESAFEGTKGKGKRGVLGSNLALTLK